MRRRSGLPFDLVVAAVVALVACRPTFEADPPPASPTCPSGYALDVVREVKLFTRLEGEGIPTARSQKASPLCFGPARSLGLLAGTRVVLRASATDDELAARLAHLLVHLEADAGDDGCAHGVAQAIATEERARGLEQDVRARASLGPPPEDPEESRRAIERRCSAR